MIVSIDFGHILQYISINLDKINDSVSVYHMFVIWYNFGSFLTNINIYKQQLLRLNQDLIG